MKVSQPLFAFAVPAARKCLFEEAELLNAKNAAKNDIASILKNAGIKEEDLVLNLIFLFALLRYQHYASEDSSKESSY